MDWLLEFKLWENPLVYRTPRTPAERLERVRYAVICKAFSRNCIIIMVDFGGTDEQKKLSPPTA